MRFEKPPPNAPPSAATINAITLLQQLKQLVVRFETLAGNGVNRRQLVMISKKENANVPALPDHVVVSTD